MFRSQKVFPFYFPETVSTMNALQNYGCNTLRGTPTQFFDLVNHPLRKKFDLSKLKYMIVGASTVPPELLMQLKKEMNIEQFFVGYGNTSRF